MLSQLQQRFEDVSRPGAFEYFARQVAFERIFDAALSVRSKSAFILCHNLIQLGYVRREFAVDEVEKAGFAQRAIEISARGIQKRPELLTRGRRSWRLCCSPPTAEYCCCG